MQGKAAWKSWFVWIAIIAFLLLVPTFLVAKFLVPSLIARGVEVGTIWGWSGVFLGLLSIGVTGFLAKLVYDLQQRSAANDRQILRTIGGADGTGGVLKEVRDAQAEMHNILLAADQARLELEQFRRSLPPEQSD